MGNWTKHEDEEWEVIPSDQENIERREAQRVKLGNLQEFINESRRTRREQLAGVFLDSVS